MVENSWVNLPKEQPRVLANDKNVLDKFEEKYKEHKNYENYKFQTHLLPEPFFGDKDAPIYLLALNPGYAGKNDDVLHENIHFIEAVRNTQQGINQDCPFYYFDPRFEDSPGAKWWKRICSSLINDLGENGCQIVAKGLFCIELFPYHSKAYKQIPKNISENHLVPSCDYSIELVNQAINNNKIIIVMRSYKLWNAAVQELKLEENCFLIKNPRNPSLTPNNLTAEIYNRIKEIMNKIV